MSCSTIELFLDRGNANFFADFFLRLKPEDFLLAHPRLRIGFRVSECHGKFQGVARTPPAFFEAHFIAIGITELVEPGPVIKTQRVHDESISFPMSNRITEPTRIRILGKS